MASLTLPVQTQLGAYDVCVRPTLHGLGEAVAAVSRSPRAVLVTDDTVGPLWADAAERALAGVDLVRLVIPAGERNKHRDTWWGLVDGLLEARVDRRTPVIALGGGVVGDLAGFAAAATLRGLPVIQVPTTLLAMVDSSVGGKTGFNHPLGKNLVGAFHQPVLVWAALETLQTLEPRARNAGLGEAVKHGLIDDAALFERLESDAAAVADGHPDVLAEVVAACVRSKAGVVADDEREKGRRAILNAGHTVAHAIEQVAGYGAWFHGEAVAMGLVAETAWAEDTGLTEEPGLARRVSDLVDALGMPSAIPDLDATRLEAAMRVDKKTHGDMLRVPAPMRVGEVRLVDLPLHNVSHLLSVPR
jgi:3-dehydroquinate synthase